ERPRGVLLARGGRGRPHLHPRLRLPEPVRRAVRGRAGPGLAADQHPARRGRGRAARPHLPPARRPAPLRLPRGGRAGRPLHRGVPAGDGVRVRARGRALRPGALPPRRGGPAVARAGGRAYSFADPATGEVVDNGPHALMGAYTEALDFLREIGASAKLRVQPRLRVALAHPELGVGEVAAPPVPGPLQAPLALLRYRLLAPGDRVRLLAGALRLTARDRALAGRTVAQALADVGQSRAACERFWHPLAIATLNEAPEMAAAAPFAAVLRRAFFAGAPAARFALARVPLSDLYTGDARRAIETAGGRMVTGAAVASLA